MIRLPFLPSALFWIAAGLWILPVTGNALVNQPLKEPTSYQTIETDRPELDFRRINVELLENADAVVRKDLRRFRQDAPGLSGTYEYDRIITIINRSGLGEADVRIMLALGERLNELEVLLYDGRGNFVRRIGREDFEQHQQAEAGRLVAQEVTELSTRLRHGSFPFTLHLRYVKAVEDVAEFPEWQPAGDGVAIEQAAYHIEIPPGQRLIAERYPESEAFVAEVQFTGGIQRYSWRTQEYPSRRMERNGPPAREVFPTLVARPLLIKKHGYHGRLQRWNDAGNWLRSVRFGRHHLAPEDMVLARRLRPVGPELQRLLDMRIDVRQLGEIRPLPAPQQMPPLPNPYWEEVFANLQNPDFYERPDLPWLKALAYQPRNPRPVARDQEEDAVAEVTRMDDFQVLNSLVRHVIRRFGDRYVSRPMPLYDFMPTMPRELVRRQQADADDLSYYMRTLLKFAGIEAYQAFLARDTYAPAAWKEMKNPGLRFDHAVTVAVVEGDTLWIDPGNLQSGFPLSYLGYGVSNRSALLLRTDDAVIVATPKLDADRNRQRRRADVVLSTGGNASAEIITEYTGQQHEFIRRLSEMAPQQQQYALFQSLAINEYSLDSVKVSAQRQLPVARTELLLSIPRLANTPGNQMVFRPNLLERRTLSIPLVEPRRQPVVISFGYEDEDVITYTLPPGYRVMEMPESARLRFPLGFYEVELSLDEENRQLHYRRRLRIEAGRIPAGQYRSYVSFMNGLYREDNREVVLVRDE